MKIERKLTVGVELTPENIADCFCDLHDDEQAFFFNRISEVVSTRGTSFCFQLQGMFASNVLTNGGKDIMHQIGECSEVMK